MDFVALDFETANPSLSSVCQVGVAEFRNGAVSDTFVSLVDPEDYFSFINIEIHGIHPEHVIGAPTFKAIYPHLAERLSGNVVVSHTPFDRSVLRQSIARHHLPEIECRWLDSTRVIRRTWLAYAKNGYGLASITSALGISFRHHDALEDAKAAGMVLLRAIAESGVSLEDWLVRSFFPIGSDTSALSRDGNPNGALFGECLVFTGALQVLRREAADLAAQVGCMVMDHVSKKTTILVVGDQDIMRLAPGEMKSSKHRKAEDLIKAGHTIRIIGESDFMALCRTEVHASFSREIAASQPSLR